jgi:N-acetylglucosamine repressor
MREPLKNQNANMVLRTIYHSPKISRADIARVTALTRPTVSSIVSDLMDRQLVTEVGFGPSIGGKPPLMLEINSDVWRILCLDIGSQEFRGALINLRGVVLERITIPSQEHVGDSALQLVYQLIDKLSIGTMNRLLGIAIGTPGLIDTHAGVVREAVNLNWHNLPLQNLLSERYDVPIYLANDSQAAALAEYTFGEDRQSSHLLLIRMGRGIGAGIILNGELFHGDGAGAGEIGHVVLDDSGRTLEDHASTRAVIHAARQVAGEQLTWEEMIDRVRGGDAALGEIIDQAGRALGISLAHLISALNINNIIISGRIDQFGDRFRHTAYNTAQQRILPQIFENTSLSYSGLGTDIVLLGCAAFILKYELGII